MDKMQAKIDDAKAKYELTDVKFFHLRTDGQGGTSPLLKTGGYLIATVCYFLKDEKIISRGIAVRSMRDNFNRQRGRDIAFGRAKCAMIRGTAPNICRLDTPKVSNLLQVTMDDKGATKSVVCDHHPLHWLFYRVPTLQAWHPQVSILDTMLLVKEANNDASLHTE